MNETLRFVVTDDYGNKYQYHINLKNLRVKPHRGIEADDVFIDRNGELLEEGELGSPYISWRKYDEDDILSFALRDYLNNNGSIEYEIVPEKFRELKEENFIPFREVDGHVFPETYYNEYLEPLPVQIVTSEGAGYTDGSNFVIVDEKGRILSDMENFYEEGVAEWLLDDNVEKIFVSECEQEYLEALLE